SDDSIVKSGSNVRVQRHEQLTFDRPSALEALASTGYGCSTLRAVAGDATYRGSVNGRNVAETVNSSGRHGRQQPLHCCRSSHLGERQIRFGAHTFIGS